MVSVSALGLYSAFFSVAGRRRIVPFEGEWLRRVRDVLRDELERSAEPVAVVLQAPALQDRPAGAEDRRDGWILDDDVLLGGGRHERRGFHGNGCSRLDRGRLGRAGCLSAGWRCCHLLLSWRVLS